MHAGNGSVRHTCRYQYWLHRGGDITAMLQKALSCRCPCCLSLTRLNRHGHGVTGVTGAALLFFPGRRCAASGRDQPLAPGRDQQPLLSPRVPILPLLLLLLLLTSCLQGVGAFRCACDEPKVCGTKTYCNYPSGSSCSVEIDFLDGGYFVYSARKCLLPRDAALACPHQTASPSVRYAELDGRRGIVFCCQGTSFCNSVIVNAVQDVGRNFSAIPDTSYLAALRLIATDPATSETDSTSNRNGVNAGTLGLLAALSTLVTIIVIATGLILFCVCWRRRLRRRQHKKVVAAVANDDNQSSSVPSSSHIVTTVDIQSVSTSAAQPSPCVQHRYYSTRANPRQMEPASPSSSSVSVAPASPSDSDGSQQLPSPPPIPLLPDDERRVAQVEMVTPSLGPPPLAPPPCHVPTHTTPVTPRQYHAPSPSLTIRLSSSDTSFDPLSSIPSVHSDFPPAYDEIDNPRQAIRVNLPPQYSAALCEAPVRRRDHPEWVLRRLAPWHESRVPPNRHVMDAPDCGAPLPWDSPGPLQNHAAIQQQQQQQQQPHRNRSPSNRSLSRGPPNRTITDKF